MFLRALVLVWSLHCWGALAETGISSERYRLRLVGGSSRCRGELQVKMSRQKWMPLGPLNVVPLWLGHRVCAELDCGQAVTTDWKKVSAREALQAPPYCEDSATVNCLSSDSSYSTQVLELTCSDSVQLVSGQSQCSGSLQIRDQSLNQSWTSVCEGALGHQGAEVLCRELGCGAPLLQGELSPLGQMFHCEGNESALMDCPRNQTRTDPGTCSSLNLTCSEPLRLVGGSSRCEGTVEAKYNGQWRQMKSSGLWELSAASTICRDLDCGSAVSTEKRRGFNKSEVWEVSYDCLRKRAAVRDCIWKDAPHTGHSLKLVCSDSVRLDSWASLCSGFVQIHDKPLGQSWISVCAEALGHRGAEVLCRELGCGPPVLQGELSPQTFHCEGNESALMDCPHNQITRTDPATCSAPRLICSEPMRLVGGPSHCEGTVELKNSGEWRRLVPTSYQWRLDSSLAVCEHLDCGSAVSIKRTGGHNKSTVWDLSSECMWDRAAVRECAFTGSNAHVYGMEVVCSGHQRAPEETESTT